MPASTVSNAGPAPNSIAARSAGRQRPPARRESPGRWKVAYLDLSPRHEEAAGATPRKDAAIPPGLVRTAQARAWSRSSGKHGRTGNALLAELVEWDRPTYHAANAIQLATVGRAKYKRLKLALWAGVLALLMPASGASLSLLGRRSSTRNGRWRAGRNGRSRSAACSCCSARTAKWPVCLTAAEKPVVQPAMGDQPAVQPPAVPAEAGVNVATVGQPARDGKFEFVVTAVDPPVKTLWNAHVGEARYNDTLVIGLEDSDRAFLENSTPVTRSPTCPSCSTSTRHQAHPCRASRQPVQRRRAREPVTEPVTR
jgi:hypothetical protein